MVTRVYCDHCGNAAHNAQKYIFGSHAHFFGILDPGHGQQTTQYQTAQNQQNISAGCLGGLSPKTSEIVRAGNIDLCDTCQIVWMNRVKALTQASEP